MENNNFDRAAREALSYDPEGPSEKVWRELKRRRRNERLPSAREILVSGFASAAALLAAWVILADETSQAPPVLEDSGPALVYRAAVRDDAKLMLAAITKIEGM